MSWLGQNHSPRTVLLLSENYTRLLLGGSQLKCLFSPVQGRGAGGLCHQERGCEGYQWSGNIRSSQPAEGEQRWLDSSPWCGHLWTDGVLEDHTEGYGLESIIKDCSVEITWAQIDNEGKEGKKQIFQRSVLVLWLYVLKIMNGVCAMNMFCSSPSRIGRQAYPAGADGPAAGCVSWTLVMCAVPPGDERRPRHQQQEQRNPFVQRYSGVVYNRILQENKLWR